MNLLSHAVLLLTATLPLAAQDSARTALPKPEPVVVDPVDPKPSAPAFALVLEVMRTAPLRLSLQSAEPDDQPFLAVLLAAVHDKTITIEGLPPLLFADAIVATVIGKRDAQFELGKVSLPFTVWLQGIAVQNERIEASPVLELAPAK